MVAPTDGTSTNKSRPYEHDDGCDDTFGGFLTRLFREGGYQGKLPPYKHYDGRDD